MSTAPYLRVVIPTLNSAEEVDSTLESIWAQDGGCENVLVTLVDFGSTDGTVEKALRHREKRCGVLVSQGGRIGRTMVADAVRMLEPYRTGGSIVVLEPGDVLYANALRTLRDGMRRAGNGSGEPVVAGRADCKLPDGTIQEQAPLFDRPALLRARCEDSLEYARRGYRHRVLCAGPYTTKRDFVATQFNQRRRWNDLASAGMVQDVAYMSEAIGCVSERLEADELDSLLFRMGRDLVLFRGCRESLYIGGSGFEPAMRMQTAVYGLWRAFLLHESGRPKDAEDCFLMAGVFCPAVKSEACWQDLSALLERGSATAREGLREFFRRDSPAEVPRNGLP